MVQPGESSSMIAMFSSVRSRWWDRQDTAVLAFHEDGTQLSRPWKLFWLGSVTNVALESRCNVFPSTYSGDNAGEDVFDTLKFVQAGFWHAGESCVAIVKSGTDYSAYDGFRGICWQQNERVAIHGCGNNMYDRCCWHCRVKGASRTSHSGCLHDQKAQFAHPRQQPTHIALAYRLSEQYHRLPLLICLGWERAKESYTASVQPARSRVAFDKLSLFTAR